MSEQTVEVVEAVEKKTRKQYGVPDEVFCETWQTSESAQEVADKLGMPKNIVSARSAVYRNRGVALKTMKRKNPKKLDVDKLNQKIAALMAGAEVVS